MADTRYFLCAHVPVQNGQPFPRNEPFKWKGCGFVPSITGKPEASVLVALIDAPDQIEACERVVMRFGRGVHFVWVSPKPENWTPPGFDMAH